MSQQQTVLRVQTSIPHLTITGETQYQTLDLDGDIPIKINKSFAELQDISKRNSDYSIGLTLPGSKKNNRFFESFFNVDSQSLYFNATLRVNCLVLLGDQVYFRGYLRLNKVSVINSKVEYDVTLYSTVGDLFGEIGNNLLKDLNYTDTEYTFNHTFNLTGVTESFAQFNFFKDSEYTYPYFYPIVHNGYNYESISGVTLPNISGATINDQTRLYTSTTPIGAWTGSTAAYTAGAKEYYINAPAYGLRDNQLKPALNIWSLIKLIFKSYGYTLSGDFFNTPWVKGLYLYGYFSSEETKFGYKLDNIEQLPLEGIEIIFTGGGTPTGNAIVCKKGTGIPCYCLSDINVTMVWDNPLPVYFDSANIKAGTSGATITPDIRLFSESDSISANSWQSIPFRDSFSLRYEPVAVGSTVSYTDGQYVDFNLVIDQNIKQIDILGSIAKKFDLVFIPNPYNPKDIQIYPFDFYMGTGEIYDWTPKLSWDKGFTVEPALNYIESNLILTDQEDNDEGNRIFKIQNNRIYGQNNVYNPTDFKSQEKKIDTIFSPELIRVWDDNINLPLGINYSASSEISSYDNQIRWLYKGVKTKPKLFYWMGANNPFIDKSEEVFNYYSSGVNTYTVKIQNSSSPGGGVDSFYKIPTISHTMPMGGLTDLEKSTNGFDNDKLCILFNSESPTDTIGVQTFNTYTENDIYNTFYKNRITNIYSPNTRFLSGYFDLKYSDVQNLYPNDVVKINEQIFYVNKISDFNLTNRELTKVELIQFNVQTQVYPTRYFKYQYCDQTGYTFSFKTDFTNSNLRNTNEAWALYYDYQLGCLTGSTTGFTSVFKYFNASALTENYVPYTMYEITKDEYDTGGYIDWTCDTLRNYLFSVSGTGYLFPPFWQNIAVNKTGACVWDSCSSYSSAASTYSIRTGSSTYYGAKIC
jgi:hypothetical protein